MSAPPVSQIHTPDATATPSVARPAVVSFQMAYATYPAWRGYQGLPFTVSSNPGPTIDGSGVTIGTAVTIQTYTP